MLVDDTVMNAFEEINEILQNADKPMDATAIESELLKRGYPAQISDANMPLLEFVYVYLNTPLLHFYTIELPDESFVYVPQYFTDDIQDLEVQARLFSIDPFMKISDNHLNGIREILTNNLDLRKWADDNEKNTDPKIRFMSHIAQYSNLLNEGLTELEYVQKAEKLINKMLSDTNFRIVCLGILKSSDTQNPEIVKKLSELLDNQNYAGLIGMQRYNHPEILKKFHKLALSSDESDMLNGLTGLKNCDAFESLPLLLDSLEQIDVVLKLVKKYDDLFSELKEHIVKVARQQGRMPKEVKSKLIKLCHSDDLSIQTLALKCLKSKWLKADIPMIENIPENNNPLAAKMKLRALYKKNAESSFNYARKMLDHKQSGIRDVAIEALGEIGGKEELDLLMDLGKDIDNYNTELIIEAINKIKNRTIGKIK